MVLAATRRVKTLFENINTQHKQVGLKGLYDAVELAEISLKIGENAK